MSFPRKLQILIVEDDPVVIDGYRKLLDELRPDFPHSPPTVVASLAAAREAVAQPRPYHVVILDMNLPFESRTTAAEGVNPGELLIDLLAARDAYPVPVLLVVSGKLGLIDLGPVGERLRRDFWHGELVNKGPGQGRAIRAGLDKALQYCDVGIHLQDGGRRYLLPLSPREDDMLRRCVLAHDHCLGVDLEWWAAEEGPTVSHPDPNAGPTKVLMGTFLVDDGVGPSGPRFFKFEPAGNAPYTARGVGIFAQKLPHVTRGHTGVSRDRSLLVTPSATGNRPVSLGTFLAGNPSAVQSVVPMLVRDIVEQLDRLCHPSDQQRPAGRAILWSYLHEERYYSLIRRYWDAGDVRDLFKTGHANPIELMDRLRENTNLIWVRERTCTHGDLNVTNIAIDPSADGRPRAFVIDPGGVTAELDLRDLAYLEVTTLLFYSTGEEHRLVLDCRGYYESDLQADGVEPQAGATAFVRNAMALVQAIRKHAAGCPDARFYPALVFDAALRQLLGLAIQPKRNKVLHPLHARYLASWAGDWASKMVPEAFGERPASVVGMPNTAGGRHESTPTG